MRLYTKQFWSIVILATLFLSFVPSRSQAFGPCATPPVTEPNPAFVWTQDIHTNIAVTSQAFDTKAECIKHYLLDGLAWTAANTAIQSITSSLVNWINSGFQGKPAFVQDLKGHFQDLANATFEDMLKIFDVEDFVCSSFSARIKKTFDIQLAVAQGGGRNAGEKTFFKSAKCTVDDVLKNVNSTISDFENDFSKGGWDAWISLTRPENNEVGAMIKFHDELWRRQSEKKENDEKELSFGQGFMSWKKEVCSVSGGDDTADGGVDTTTEECHNEIQTPGKVIQDQLDQSLGGGQRRLEVADEINEIIGAIMGQLVNQVLTKGLAGASSGGNSGSSLTDQLRDERAGSGSLTETVTDQINSVNEYITTKQTELFAVQSAKNDLQTLLSCYRTHNQSTAQTEQKISILENKQQSIQGSIDAANAYKQRLNTTGNGSSNPNDINAISRLYAEGAEFSPTQARFELSTTQDDMSAISSQARSDLTACNALP